MSCTLLMLLLLAACRTMPGAPTADAGAVCYRQCTPSLTDTGVRWTGDPEDPTTWDNLGEQDGPIPILSQLLLACESARQECAGFINSLKKRGVIRAREQ